MSSRRNFMFLASVFLWGCLPNAVLAGTFSSFNDGSWLNSYTWGKQNVYQGINVDGQGNIYLSVQFSIYGGIGYWKVVPPTDAVANQITLGDTIGDPDGSAFAANGDFIITDATNHRILKINPSTGSILRTYTLTNSQVVFSLALDRSGNIYASDANTNTIIEINATTSAVIHTYTASSTLMAPYGIAVDDSGHIFVSDSANNYVLKINPNDTVAETLPYVAGTMSEGVLFDTANHNLLIYDSSQNKVFRINPSNDLVLASYDISFCRAPSGMAIGPNGHIYFSCAGQAFEFNPVSNSISATYYLNVLGQSYPSGSSDDVNLNNNVSLDIDVDIGSMAIGGGSLDMGGHALGVHGSWRNTSGTRFDDSSGVVTFYSSSTQIIAGPNSFNDLTESSSLQGAHLYFDSSTSTVVHGNLRLAGASGSNLSLAGLQGLDLSRAISLAPLSVAAPVDLSIAADGSMFVSDPGNAQIVKIDPGTGLALAYYTGQGALINPRSAVADSGGNVFVVDSDVPAIYKLDHATDAILRTYTFGGDTPSGISLGSNNDFFTVDTDLESGQVLDVDIATGNTIASYDSMVGTPLEAAALTDRFGDIYSSNGNSILVSSSTNPGLDHYIRDFGQGFSFGSIQKLMSGQQGAIVVLDSGNNKIYSFSVPSISSWTIESDNGQSSINLSNLSVFGSLNASSRAFSCSSCVDLGSNVNWSFPVQESAPSSSSSSSGGGGGSSVSPSLLQQLLGLFTPSIPGCPIGFLCRPITPSITPSVPVSVPTASYPFKNDLQLLNVNNDVLILQQYLNNHGYQVSSAGPGSPGHETLKFGGATKAALMKFQKAHGIPVTGFFGPKTRAYVTGHP